jgi:hypothetical protein
MFAIDIAKAQTVVGKFRAGSAAQKLFIRIRRTG